MHGYVTCIGLASPVLEKFFAAPFRILSHKRILLMARIRSIHPSLWTDEAFVSVSPFARLFLIGLWNESDDNGVFQWKPLTLKMRLLPGDMADVNAILDELLGIGAIRSYEVEGTKYGAVRNFRKFQRPEKPKTVHPINEDIAVFVALSSRSHTCSERSPGSVGDNSTTEPLPTHDRSPTIHRRVTDDSPTSHLQVAEFMGPMEEGGGNRNRNRNRKGEELEDGGNREFLAESSLATDDQSAAASKNVRGSRIPGDWKPDRQALDYANKIGFSDEHAVEIAETFCAYWQSEAGAKARKLDWGMAFRVWLKNQNNRRGKQPAGNQNRQSSPMLELANRFPDFEIGDF